MKDLEKIINSAWENKENVDQNSDQDLKHAINEIINKLDSGKVRVAEKIDGKCSPGAPKSPLGHSKIAPGGSKIGPQGVPGGSWRGL